MTDAKPKTGAYNTNVISNVYDVRCKKCGTKFIAYSTTKTFSCPVCGALQPALKLEAYKLRSKVFYRKLTEDGRRKLIGRRRDR